MKKLITVILGTLLIVGMVLAQDISDITTTLVNSATDLPAFGTRGASKVIIFYVMPDSTDTLWTRITGGSYMGDSTFVNMDANGDTLKYALSQFQEAWSFSVVIEHTPPFLKVEMDSIAYSNDTVWDMATGVRHSGETITIRKVFIY